SRLPLVSAPAPAHAGGGVFQQHALGGQLVTDRVGTGEVARLLGGGALVDQRLDAGIVPVVAATAEPLRGVLLQQAQRESCAQQLALGAGARHVVAGPARLAGDARQFG